MKRFDEKGQPVTLMKGIAYSKQIRDYRSAFICRGENVPKPLVQYLRRIGQEHLIPARALQEAK
ncbi:MAG: hypothetical protein K2W95_18500 [Candidatus Obscuribacterales bacterium]|nr:hypothetical protein [Candidatus Obscuribacterales bacterium]